MNPILIRILSGFAMGFTVLFSYRIYGVDGLKVLSFGIIALGSIEFASMSSIRQKELFPLGYLFIGANLALLYLSSFPKFNSAPVWGLILVGYLGALLWRSQKLEFPVSAFKVAGESVMGMVYCALIPSLALVILDFPLGHLWFLYLLVVVFVGDTTAYFTGMAFGKKKLFPQLSPKKTIAGAVGGCAGSIIAGMACWYFFFKPLNPISFLALSAGASFLAQTGDLFESLMKRYFGVKDSGKLIPGHGGILDRVDGLLFATPLVYAAVSYVNTH